MIEDSLPFPEVYYDPQGKTYFMRNERGYFISFAIADIRSELKEQGHSDKVLDGERVSPIDKFLNRVRRCHDVDYAGPLAGYQAGIYSFQNRRVLVTEGPHFIEPMEGSWSTLEAVIRGLLVPDEEPSWGDPETQLWYFYSWLKVAITTLRAGKRRPGQVLVIAGPRCCGKSFLQNVITLLFGGRSGKPYQFLAGLTQFNSDLFTGEHLMIEDEAADHDHRVRRKLGAMLKGLVANETQRCHPKNRPALMLSPFWRVSITLNDEPEDVMVLPPVDEGLADKLMLFRAFKKEMPMPTETTEQWSTFNALIHVELPHFLHWLINTWQIPAGMRSHRFGVGHFHNPEILEMMASLSSEEKLLELIDARLFHKDSESSLWVPWEGKSSELELELTAASASTSYEARRLLYFNSACGSFLGRLAQRHPERVSKRICEGYTIWKINPPSPSTV